MDVTASFDFAKGRSCIAIDKECHECQMGAKGLEITDLVIDELYRIDQLSVPSDVANSDTGEDNWKGRAS